jgi:aspartyl-tRNA(Asn)/glutamyl-tRNA(Gln) amidotransferase subunit C
MTANMSMEEIERVVLNARLGLTNEEKDSFVVGLNEMLDYVARLDEVDTEAVDPMLHNMSVVRTVLSDDTQRESLDKTKVLANAASVEDGAFKVPKVFE